MERKTYPIGQEFYTLYEEVGQGVSAAVHRALCKPLDEIVAIKILDFERENCDLVLLTYSLNDLSVFFCILLLSDFREQCMVNCFELQFLLTLFIYIVNSVKD